MAVWILIPDRLDDADAVLTKKSMGVFGTTAFTFFLAGMGDKTPIVTVALAVPFREFFGVVGCTRSVSCWGTYRLSILRTGFAQRLFSFLPLSSSSCLAALP
jgi:putative Ca2+/H+ antiporter (TMEM165/GDT1 family)